MRLYKQLLYKILIVVNVLFFSSLIYGCKRNSTPPSLKDAYKDQFLIGMAMNTDQIVGSDAQALEIIKKQCNSITSENCMKGEVIQPVEGQFNFALADSFVTFGKANGMKIIGHNLIWHSQAPIWFFTDDEGNDVTREVMIERMKNHIYTVVGRYKGQVHGWDVVNEAFLDDGSMRETKFYSIVGEDYIKLAFQFAHEADPNAELYYNDFSMDKPGKVEAIIKLVNELKGHGIRIDGVGMQSHCGLTYSDLDSIEISLNTLSNAGMKVMITELDVSVLPLPKNNIGADVSTSFEYQKKMNPYTGGLPDSISKELEKFYIDLFKLFLKYQPLITRVTFWGVNDAQSWKNYWPIEGRSDYPLLYDRNYKPKDIVDLLINLPENNR